LFGLNLSKSHIRERNQAIVVEGYTDLISLYSSGIKNVICSSGTALTSSQASLISRFANTVVTLFDSDAAGLKAAGRSVGEFLSKGLDILICVLPDEEDPDSFIKSNGANRLQELIDKALPYPEFKKMSVGKNFRDLSASEQEELVIELNKVVFQISDPLKRRLLTDRLERAFDFPISSFHKKEPGRKDAPEKQDMITRDKATLEREFLALLSENRTRLPEISKIISPECFAEPGCRMVYVRMIDEYSRNKSMEFRKWVGMDVPAQVVETLVGMENSVNRLVATPEVLDDYINRFRAEYSKSVLRDLKNDIVAAENAGDTMKADELQKRYLRILTGAINR